MTAEHQTVIDVRELGISDYALSLYTTGHPRDVIRHETQDLLNELQERSGRKDLDGQDLVQAALADSNPLIRVNDLQTGSDRDEHAATRFLLLGMVRGFRNQYSHDVRIEVGREEAAIWLGVLGSLRRRLGPTRSTPESSAA